MVIGALRHRSAVRAEGEVMVGPRLAASVRAQGFLVLLAKFMVEVRKMLWLLENEIKGQKWMEIVLKPALIPLICSWRKGLGKG